MQTGLAMAARCAVLGILATCDASAATTVLTPVQDTTLFSQDPGAGNGAGPNLFVGSTVRSNGVRRSLLSFDLSAIPAGADIESVALRLTADQVGETSAFAITLHRVASSWGEGTAVSVGGGGAAAGELDATWTRRFNVPGPAWVQVGGDFVAGASAQTNVGSIGSYQWSGSGMVSDVQSWLDAPSTNFGWVMIGAEAMPGSAKRFASREHGLIGDRPTLTVTYAAPVPESPVFAMLLCGLGAVGCVLRARQRKVDAAKLVIRTAPDARYA